MAQAYDFKPKFTSTFSKSVTTQLVKTQFRTLHGLFGPKFQTGWGPFRIFVTTKVGFDNFSISNQNASAGFVNTVGLTSGKTTFAVYPGGGFEAFAGPRGIRAETGDDIFFINGAHNNLRVSFGHNSASSLDWSDLTSAIPRDRRVCLRIRS